MIVILMSFTCSHNDESNLMSFCSHNSDSNLMSFTSLHCLSSGIPHLAVAQPHRRREWMCCAGKASGIKRRGYLHQCSQHIAVHVTFCDETEGGPVWFSFVRMLSLLTESIDFGPLAYQSIGWISRHLSGLCGANI